MRWQLRQFPGPSLLSPRLILGVSCNLNSCLCPVFIVSKCNSSNLHIINASNGWYKPSPLGVVATKNCVFLPKIPVLGKLYSIFNNKHGHRQNITGYHSFSFLWLFQLLWISSQDNFYHSNRVAQPAGALEPGCEEMEIKICHILSQNVKYITFIANVTKILTYSL